jgi:hypothetical protein
VYGPPGLWKVANAGMPLDTVGFPETTPEMTQSEEGENGREVTP